jgi:hypothetical protein
MKLVEEKTDQLLLRKKALETELEQLKNFIGETSVNKVIQQVSSVLKNCSNQGFKQMMEIQVDNQNVLKTIETLEIVE